MQLQLETKPGISRKNFNVRMAARELTLRQFAISHGYKPRTVQIVVQRYLGKAQQPRGRLTYRILRDLSLKIGVEIVPGLLEGN